MVYHSRLKLSYCHRCFENSSCRPCSSHLRQVFVGAQCTSPVCLCCIGIFGVVRRIRRTGYAFQVTNTKVRHCVNVNVVVVARLCLLNHYTWLHCVSMNSIPPRPPAYSVCAYWAVFALNHSIPLIMHHSMRSLSVHIYYERTHTLPVSKW